MPVLSPDQVGRDAGERRWLPDATWVLRMLFRGLLVACLGGMALDATGRFPGAAPPVASDPVPQPTDLERPAPGDTRRPYRPELVPRPQPGRDARPSLPDGTPIVAPPFDRMSFTATDIDGVPAILAVGDIATGTAEEFARFRADGAPEARLLFLQSRGGAVDEAMEMGRMVRQAGLATVVPREGFCFSACPLILAAGTDRHVYPDAWVGLHRSRLVAIAGGRSDPAATWEAGQAAVAEILDYLDEMAVDPLVWRWALETPHAEITMLPAEDLLETALATSVSDALTIP